MRVLYINARYIPEGVGGPAHSTRFLAEHMVRQGHQAAVFCRSAKPGISREEMNGVSVVRAGFDVPLLQAMGLFTQLLDEFAPELIHSMFPREFPLAVLTQASQRRNIPVVQTLLSFNFLCHQSFVRNGQNCTAQCAECRRNTQAERDYCESVTAVVGMSRYMLELHEKSGLFADTPLKRVIFDAYEPAAEAASLPTGNGGLRIGYLGRLNPLKGVELLLDALNSPTLAKDAWTLKIAGTGEASYEQSLRAKYADPRIEFLGFVEPGRLLSGIDVLVAPALWEEPFGRIVIEAYAHGVPVIASRRGGMKETVEPGVTGWLFEPGRKGELGKALRECLDAAEKLEEMKESAHARWRQRFTPAVVGGQYLEVYEETLARKG